MKLPSSPFQCSDDYSVSQQVDNNPLACLDLGQLLLLCLDKKPKDFFVGFGKSQFFSTVNGDF